MPQAADEVAALRELLWSSATLYAARLTPDGMVLEANEPFERWAGRRLEGAALTDLVSITHRAAVKRALGAANGARQAITVSLQGGASSIRADRSLSILRDGDDLLAVAEPSEPDADRLLREVLQLNDELIDAQRQLSRRQRELERAQAEAAEALERLRRLEAIMLAGFTSPDLDSLLQTLLSNAREVFRADRAAVLLRDDTGAFLRVSAAIGMDDDVREQVRVPLGRGLAGTIASSGRARIVDDLANSEAVSAYLREGGGSLAGVPLIVEEEVIGVLHVSSLQRNRFTEEDLRLLERVGERAALAIGHAQLRERERAVAETLQRSLLPERLPGVEGLAICARYLSRARGIEVGGDFYDAVELDDGRIVLAIGDVAGKGLEAASTMGRLRTTLRVYAQQGAGPTEILARLDRMVVEEEAMATAILLELDPATGRVIFANAGHPPPLRLLAGAAEPVTWLSGALTPPLGTGWPERALGETVLAPGELMLLFTDGLVERRDRPLDTGMERLSALTLESPEVGVEELCDLALQRFAPAGAGFEDDVALLAVQLRR